MMILAIDSISERPGAALWRDGIIAVKSPSPSEKVPRASDRLLPFVSELLEEAGARLDQLDGIALTAGPGSFTGIRVGLALVKGLLFQRTLPVAAVSTLDLLADLESAALPSVQLRKTEWFLALSGETRSVDAETWRALTSGRDVILLGEAPTNHQARINRVVDSLARTVARMGAEKIRQGNGVPVEQVTPLYLRNTYVA
ncbi:MAG: tRNA (adenosine(37)-N6)-threonylcarbamoyltransferase complex dimerization subunit type 1 TsaB [Candidatus Hydrogenedentota bacterium]